MAGNYVHAVTESLDHGAMQADTAVADTHSNMTQVQSTVDAVRPMLSGTAPMALDQVHAKWVTETTRLTEMLSSLGINVRYTAAQDQEMDEIGRGAIGQAMVEV